jgi:splicing factor 3B subunit 3
LAFLPRRFPPSTSPFALVRAGLLRRPSNNVDYIIVGSDSGRIVILEYVASPPSFKKLHQETYGKSGSRRIVPGQYLATDPKGRAVMIGAVEKAKLVYILNRDAAANLTISSPLEAHKQHAIILSIVGVDVGFDNPMFAALEVDYSDSDNDPTGAAFDNADKVSLPLPHPRPYQLTQARLSLRVLDLH